MKTTSARAAQAIALCAALLLTSGCGEYSPLVGGGDAQTSTPDARGTDPGARSDTVTPDPLDPVPDAGTDAPGVDDPGTAPDESTPIADAGRSGGGGGSRTVQSGMPGSRSGTSANRDAGATGATASPGGGDEPNLYVWQLPPTDQSPTGNDGPAYGRLRAGCRAAMTYMSDTVGNQMWQFSEEGGPRYLVMYVSGLAYCVERPDLGSAYFAGAVKVYGTQALDRVDTDAASERLYPQNEPPGWGEPWCDLYRTLVSIRDQVGLETIACMRGGDNAGFASQPYGFDKIYDDPCTFDVDESTAPWTGQGDPPSSWCGPMTAERLLIAKDAATDQEAGAILFAGIDAAAILAAVAAAPPYEPKDPPTPFPALDAVGVTKLPEPDETDPASLATVGDGISEAAESAVSIEPLDAVKATDASTPPEIAEDVVPAGEGAPASEVAPGGETEPIGPTAPQADTGPSVEPARPTELAAAPDLQAAPTEPQQEETASAESVPREAEQSE
ncbi:hypothetical protein [Microbacterium ulmi]|uniref:Uncharacterized protein n=1 Tax=Microbacterium ulmi TaxID=179095 RepID=A0A7Y2Q021_9MICO|nr:hypothetical protein [Microbacterium ulmi]NII70800.1 hypothetical protein [Microbacterium ulmi]NNH02817.1 hypothetical protein [Microbacterium ulmi]